MNFIKSFDKFSIKFNLHRGEICELMYYLTILHKIAVNKLYFYYCKSILIIYYFTFPNI